MLLPAWAAGKGKGPNSKFNVAIIGVGGRGGSAVKAFMESPEVNVAAFCDVDDDRAAGFYKKYPDFIDLDYVKNIIKFYQKQIKQYPNVFS